MNDIRNHFEERRKRWEERRGKGHVWTGLLLLAIGGVALAKSYGADIPAWLFSWQMLLIAIGVFIGIRKGFEGGWFIPILIGGVFLLNQYVLDGRHQRQIWPLIIVLIGIFFIIRSFQKPWSRRNRREKKNAGVFGETIAFEADESFSEEDFVNSTCVFGGSKKVVLSKSFKGGDLMNIFGGAEIDLTQADLTGIAELEITAIFGGATLIVPSNWEVKSNIVTIFGGINDKRKIAPLTDQGTKKLILKGTVIFGGVEIKSY